MANHLSALKRARQTEKRTATTATIPRACAASLREMRESIGKGDKAAAEKTYRATVSALDKAIQKGVHAQEHWGALQVPPVGKRVRAVGAK